MMRRQLLMIAMALALSMILSTGSTWAICEQQDLQGTWAVLVGGPEQCFGEHCSERCQLQIDSDGFITNTGATMETLCGARSITGGQLLMFSDCGIRGTIETSSGPLYVEHGEIVEDKLILGVSEE